jgi:hypothetical protein
LAVFRANGVECIMVNNILWYAHAGIGVVGVDNAYRGVDIYGTRVPPNKQGRRIPGMAIYNLDVLCDIP